MLDVIKEFIFIISKKNLLKYFFNDKFYKKILKKKNKKIMNIKK